MRTLTVFNNTTVDGYFAGPDGSISWAHRNAGDAEFDAFVANNAKGTGVLLLGRKTYDIMAAYWPTTLAMEQNPVVARGINAMSKVVFSRTMREAAWQNTTLVHDDIAAAVRKMKQEAGPDMTILGSGSIVAQLTAEGLIDAYQLVVNPVVLGRGRTMFEGIEKPLDLKLTKTRAFPGGNVLLCYAREE